MEGGTQFKKKIKINVEHFKNKPTWRFFWKLKSSKFILKNRLYLSYFQNKIHNYILN